jgi:hypothetical protein
VAEQRGVVLAAVRPRIPRKVPDRLVVYMTRIAPRALDTDNLASCAKAVRDSIAEALGIDDRDAHRVEYRYRQAFPAKGSRDRYAVAIMIRPRLPVDDAAEELMRRADEALGVA